MRGMVDIDALIDGATAQILPDDVKSRAVLRIALAQLLVLKSPGHAVVSTALPLVDGGPRRLVHAILSRAQQEAWQLPGRATLPLATAERWAEDGGMKTARAATEGRWAPPSTELTDAHHTRQAAQ